MGPWTQSKVCGSAYATRLRFYGRSPTRLGNLISEAQPWPKTWSFAATVPGTRRKKWIMAGKPTLIQIGLRIRLRPQRRRESRPMLVERDGMARVGDHAAERRIVKPVVFRIVEQAEYRQVIRQAKRTDCVPNADKEDWSRLFG